MTAEQIAGPYLGLKGIRVSDVVQHDLDGEGVILTVNGTWPDYRGDIRFGNRLVTDVALAYEPMTIVSHDYARQAPDNVTPLRKADADIEAKAEEARARIRDDLLSVRALRALPEPRPLIEDRLMVGSLALLYGKPKHGKSFVALDMALHVATGRWWQGQTTMRGPVVYIAAEGAAGLKQRVDAWCDHHDVTDVPDFLVYRRVLPLKDLVSVAYFVETIAEFGPVLVVVDTLARCMSGLDENSTKDMGTAVESLDRIKVGTGACVLALHHTPRADPKQIRGNTALDGALDTAILCEKEGLQVTLSCTFQKESEPFLAHGLKLQTFKESMVPVASSWRLGGVPADDAKLHATARQLLEADTDTAMSWTALAEILAPMGEGTIRRRMNDLLKRGFVENIGSRNAARWVLTDTGRVYARRQTPSDATPDARRHATTPPYKGGGAGVAYEEIDFVDR